MPEADVFGYMDIRGRPILFAEKSTSPPPGVTPFAVTSKAFSPSPVNAGATLTWTLTGTARSDGAVPTVGAVTDSGGSVWSVQSVSTTQVVLTTVADASATVTATIDGVSVSGAYTVTDAPTGTTYVGKRGWTDDGPRASETGDSVARTMSSTTWVAGDVGWAAMTGGMRAVNVPMGMRELVNVNASTKATTYKAGSIEAAIAPVRSWNAAHPGKKVGVALRMYTGMRAPQAWKDVCGTVPIVDEWTNGGDIPKFWGAKSPYRVLYMNAMRAIAAAVKGIPEVISVNVPGAAWFYPEPFILTPNSKATPTSPTNRQILLAAGWDDDQHRAFLRWLPTTVSVFERVVVYLALNPLNLGNGQPADLAIAKEIGLAHIAALKPGQAGLENYSMRERMTLTAKGGDYLAMYKWMGSLADKAWISAQLARTPNICDNPVTEQIWDKIGQWAINQGFHGLETSGPALKNKAGEWCVANAWADANDAYHDNAALFLAQNNDFRANPAPAGS